MKNYISVLIVIVVLGFLIHVNSARDWAYLCAAIIASYIAALIVERFKKLNAIGRYVVYIVVGVPIMAHIIPLSELIVLTAAGLVSTIILSNENKNKQANSDS